MQAKLGAVHNEGIAVDHWCQREAEFGVELELGPVARTGATGPLRSIYLHDPEGNLMEISNLLGAEG